MAKLLFLGDISGHGGRQWVCQKVPELRRHYSLDFIVANAENAAGGFGITSGIAKELLNAGIDGLTLGNHVWDQKCFDKEIDQLEKVCRPANLPHGNPGKPYLVLENNGLKIALFSVVGRTLINMSLDCPFFKAQETIEKLQGLNGIFLDIHAETTSEKQAIGWFLDGKVTAVIGTHTHVPTADEKILPKGTAFQTDTGMCGSQLSIIGCEPDVIIRRFMMGTPCRLTVSNQDIRLNGLIVTFDPETGLSSHVERIQIKQ